MLGLKIDKIAKKGIKTGIFPGCQIVAIKSGNVFYNKSFGHHTYDKKRKVKGKGKKEEKKDEAASGKTEEKAMEGLSSLFG